MATKNGETSTSEKKINMQIKTSEKLHQEFKQYAEQRFLSIQSAGVEALEFWTVIQKEIGSYFSTTDPDELKTKIRSAFNEAVDNWSKNIRNEKFKDDSFQKIIGMTSGNRNLSRKNDRYYAEKNS
ncbi:MAG: hypothetical protein HeimC3_47370 [Candidatus Heimdallarchaeota archaeon LC_3]|nr:MAG: hypothetical protein HeimC3_47370 [Candidatus Heimdallarchaeota archaeon LC_3]